jgi:hypothetical protein
MARRLDPPKPVALAAPPDLIRADQPVEPIVQAELGDEDVIVLDRSLWDLEDRYRRIANDVEPVPVPQVTAPDGQAPERSKRPSRHSASAKKR